MEKKKFAVAITDLLLALIGCLFILSGVGRARAEYPGDLLL